MFGRFKIVRGSGFVLIAALLVMVAAARAEEVRIAGEPYTEDAVLKPLQGPFERATGITLAVRKLWVQDAVKEMMNRSLDVVVNALPDEETFEILAKKGVDSDRASIQSTVLVSAPVSVVVARGNPLGRLSREELKAVFTGKVLNWREIGGPNEAIRIIRPWGYPVRSAFRYQIMDGEQYVSDMIKASSWEEVRAAVAETPDAIAILPTSLVDGSVKVLETPDIAQTVTLFTKGEPSPSVRKFIDFVRGEGQKYLQLIEK